MGNSIGLSVDGMAVGIAIFAGFLLFLFVSVCLKRRADPELGDNVTLISQPSTRWEEKRSHQRFIVSLHASYMTPEGIIDAQIKDISLGGAFVVCSRPLPINEHFRITIELADDKPLDLHAQVVWSNANVPADKVVSRGMGIRFLNNEAAERQLLATAISSLARPGPTPPA